MMDREEWVALLAAGGLLDALYLSLYKLGFIGSVVCVTGGGCETVQSSSYAEFMGVPTAVWGLLYYALYFILALARLEIPRPWMNRVLWGLALWGALFSTYLTGIEVFVLRAICTWCVVSWGIVLTLLVLETVGLRWAGGRPG